MVLSILFCNLALSIRDGSKIREVYSTVHNIFYFFFYEKICKGTKFFSQIKIKLNKVINKNKIKLLITLAKYFLYCQIFNLYLLKQNELLTN